MKIGKEKYKKKKNIKKYGEKLLSCSPPCSLKSSYK